MPIVCLALDHVTHTFQTLRGTKRVLDDVSAVFRTGEVALIEGPIGAGKSTLLMLLAGMHRPTAGTVRSDEDPISRWHTRHRDHWRRQVGILFQRGHLLTDLSVMENIVLPLIPSGLSVRAIEEQTAALLPALGLDALAHEPVRHLSGGERQRVAMARAIVHRPEVLLLDEPTAHQDEEGLCLIAAAVTGLRHRTVTVVVSHDPRLTERRFADRRLVLSNGALTEVAP